MNARVPVRGGSHLRRGRSIRRASARVSLTRVGATAVLLGASLALSQLGGASAFTVRRVSVEGATLTDPAQVEAALLTGPESQNLFRYDTAAAAARIDALPTVRHVTVRAVIPDLVVASLDERAPVLAWSVGDGGAGFLVDADGALFASIPAAQPDVPAVHDLRSGSATLSAGDRLAAVELRAARELGMLTAASLGSAAAGLRISITDADGFVLGTDPPGWSAVFGTYGEVVRSPDIVPLQVQCLASLLASRPEKVVGRVVLSPDGQLCGTFGGPGGS